MFACTSSQLRQARVREEQKSSVHELAKNQTIAISFECMCFVHALLGNFRFNLYCSVKTPAHDVLEFAQSVNISFCLNRLICFSYQLFCMRQIIYRLPGRDYRNILASAIPFFISILFFPFLIYFFSFPFFHFILFIPFFFISSFNRFNSISFRFDFVVFPLLNLFLPKNNLHKLYKQKCNLSE